MCDTFVVLPDASALGATALCKNSDRPAFDCQVLERHEARTAGPGASLRLAYLCVPEAPESFATVGASPYWCWGYEEGINEFGVAIGNEAVYSRELALLAAREGTAHAEPRGILGMELVRLGLERAKSATEALEVMTGLLEAYGQWGSGVPMADAAAGSYDNSYLIADAKGAWILETAGRRWAARKIETGFAAISNELTIRDEATRACADLEAHARAMGWTAEQGARFDFAAAYAADDRPRQVSHVRLQRMRSMLSGFLSQGGAVRTRDMKAILRDHYEGTFLEGPAFTAADPDFLTICMHDSKAKFTWGDTASSIVAVLPEEGLPYAWWLAGVPCTGVYIPVFAHGGLPGFLGKAGGFGRRLAPPSSVEADAFAEGSYWWEMKRLLRAVNGDARDAASYGRRHGMVRNAFDALEARFEGEIGDVLAKAARLRAGGDTESASKLLGGFTARCALEALETARGLAARLA